MEHVPYFEVLVMERDKNLKKNFFYQSSKDAQICSAKILQKISVRNVQFPLVPFRILGITYNK
jgi:hypothetical protein